MAGQQITLPAVGPVSRRALLIGGGLAVLVTGVLWWRKRSTPAAAAPTDAGLVDPSLDSGVAGGGGGGGGGGSSTSSSTTPTSNPQWTAQVMQLLGGVVDPSALAAALGLYLTGGAVTKEQELIIDQAIAAAGYPPVSGPNGYPPAIRTQPAGGQSGGGLSAPGNLRLVSRSGTQARVAWDAVTGAAGYVVHETGPNPTTQQSAFHVGANQTSFGAEVGPVTHGYTHTMWVAALASDGTEGPSSNHITFTD